MHNRSIGIPSLEESGQVIGPGDSYPIPRNVEHRIEIIESGEILDIFSPPRRDYLVSRSNEKQIIQMKLTQYQVDAFASRVFEGNPAAVCPLHEWLSDDMLQAIAEENNLSETAFFVPTAKGFHLRWFTPVAEVDLCGHATLATAHVIFEIHGYTKSKIEFETRSGTLVVEKSNDALAMDFPSIPPRLCSPPEALIQGLGEHPTEVLAASNYIAVFDNEAIIRALVPNLTKLAELELHGVTVTAPGLREDFVSRYFAPKLGVPEDPVTGSAHCELAPYWSCKLGKSTLKARQLSKRGGEIQCELQDTRVILTGKAKTFMTAEIDTGT